MIDLNAPLKLIAIFYRQYCRRTLRRIILYYRRTTSSNILFSKS